VRFDYPGVTVEQDFGPGVTPSALKFGASS